MKPPVNLPKKGECDELGGSSSIRKLASRFMKFCQNYTSHFIVHRNNVSEQARAYLAGLLMKAPRKNMERMEEYVEGCEYEHIQQFISDSPWEHKVLNTRISSDVNELIGSDESTLCLDESAFSKKGNDSVGVSRQYNGRLGKIDNCQVGVFASLCIGTHSSIINCRLYLPEDWVNDRARCDKAKIPEEYRVFKTKPELALEMVNEALDNNLSFGWVAADAFYGRDSKFLYSLEDRGLLFVADVPCDQTIYFDDPKPYMPRRRNKIGPKHKRLRSRIEGIRADVFCGQIRDSQWNKVEVRNTTKGKLYVYAHRKRVYIWDGIEKTARNWWLVITKDPMTNEIKYFLSNAEQGISLTKLVRKHADRYWIERSFQDGKTSIGMSDYQVRRWKGWHHHMSMVTLAMLFLLIERIRSKKEIELLSCQDIVELLNFYLPRKDLTEKAVFRSMLERHKKRRKSIEYAYEKQKREKLTLPK